MQPTSRGRVLIGRVNIIVRALQGHRRTLAFAIYAVIAAVAYAAAFLLRFEFAVPAAYVRVFAVTLLPLMAIRLLAIRVFRLTRERWRYASTHDVVRLAGATALGSAIFYVIFRLAFRTQPAIPLSVIGMEALLTCFLTAGVWLSYRLAFEHWRRNGSAASALRVLIIGAGDAGNMLAREMLRAPAPYFPVGFVDDDPRMWGATVQGVEVIGAGEDLPAIAAMLRADELIIAMPSAGPEELRAVVARCEATRLPVKVLPGIADVLAGEISLQQLREVRIEDLLGRAPVELELPELAEDMSGRTVLITGAAGSIGSELARQVALHRPDRLVLLDQAETDLFYLEMGLRARHPDLEIIPLVGDITEAAGTERIFALYRPNRVFHAAAYKHVPLMECNAREAIRNNVVGTWRVADAAGRHGAEKFVLVSTDKAVRPSNVMGATKRLAELVVLELQLRHAGTAYGAVRFGNVLGSNGSVVPVFTRQLEAGQPLTVTHPDATRYFMTIPEAVQLIMQASLLPEFRGHIAMLEMGEPVRIDDLAKNLLRLAGITDVASHIVYTGLRPGEKLHEELFAADEETRPTPVQKVHILRTPPLPTLAVAAQVEAWDAALRDGRDDTLLAGFYDLFPRLNAAAADGGRLRLRPGPQPPSQPRPGPSPAPRPLPYAVRLRA